MVSVIIKKYRRNFYDYMIGYERGGMQKEGALPQPIMKCGGG